MELSKREKENRPSFFDSQYDNPGLNYLLIGSYCAKRDLAISIYTWEDQRVCAASANSILPTKFIQHC